MKNVWLHCLFSRPNSGNVAPPRSYELKLDQTTRTEQLALHTVRQGFRVHVEDIDIVCAVAEDGSRPLFRSTLAHLLDGVLSTWDTSRSDGIWKAATTEEGTGMQSFSFYAVSSDISQPGPVHQQVSEN